MTTRESQAAYVVEAWAAAVRFSWAEFDGRTAKLQLTEVVKYLRGERPTIEPRDVGVCVEGDAGPHWEYDYYWCMEKGHGANEEGGR